VVSGISVRYDSGKAKPGQNQPSYAHVLKNRNDING
jgi:hypothetical protein